MKKLFNLIILHFILGFIFIGCDQKTKLSDPNISRRELLQGIAITGLACAMGQIPAAQSAQNESTKTDGSIAPKNNSCAPISRTRSFFVVKPNAWALPTGCPIGAGPQYQSFEIHKGTVQVNQKSESPITIRPAIEEICLETKSICVSPVSGPHCCANACRQNAVPFLRPQENAKTGSSTGTRREQWAAAFNSSNYQQCVKRCGNVNHSPNFHNGRKSTEAMLLIHQIRK